MPIHNDVVRQSFTERAEGYAQMPWLTDPERIARLVAAAQPKDSDRVLDVACGPGHITEAFSHICREVIGVDLTEAPLAIAKKRCQARAIANVSFQVCDVRHLPFNDESFDIVVCRLGMHHFENPLNVLQEMSRVCQSGGNVAIEEIMTSEHGERAVLHHKYETLRASAHARYIPVSELLLLFRDAGLETHTIATGEVTPEVEPWLAKAPHEAAKELRRLLEEDRTRDLSGMQPFFDDQGRLFFHEHLVVVAGRKLHLNQRGPEHKET